MKSLLQTAEWGEFKALNGEWFNFQAGQLSVLARKLPLGKYFFYIPEPISGDWQNTLESIDEDLKPFIEKYHPVFIKIEPLEKQNEEIKHIFTKRKWRPAFEEVQPEHRQWIPLDLSDEEILAQMKPKGRYNIKIAERNNVKIEIISEDNLEKGIEEFYHLISQTGKRRDFSIRPKSYFLNLVKMLYRHNLGSLYLAKYNNKTAAGAIVTFKDDFAAYLYGASSSEDRNIMAPYLMHWQIIRDAKEKECKIYDLLAISPPEREKHKYSGITQFKNQFGGESITLLGGWDKIISPVWYNLFKIAEKIRRR